MKCNVTTAADSGCSSRSTPGGINGLKGKLYLAAIVLGAAVIPLDSAQAAKVNATACGQTAIKMSQSCFSEINEEYRATLANCLNLSDTADRKDCEKQAGMDRKDAKGDCFAQKEARLDVCDMLSEDRYDPDPLTGESLSGDPIAFVDPDTIGNTTAPNPYLPLVPGRTTVLRAGEGFEETIVVHVTDEVRDILGVACRVVVDIVLLQDNGGYEAIEVTDDWYAQSTTGDVYYCGEIARNYEDGVLVNLDGSFEAGRDFAKSGVLIKAAPSVGEAHRQEFSLGEAEDVIRYLDTMAIPTAAEGGENAAFPCAPTGCVKTEEFIPPDPESGEFKYYLADTGFVLGIALEDGVITGERDELVCVGDTLAILSDPGCGIADVDALLEELCRLSPDAFCEGG